MVDQAKRVDFLLIGAQKSGTTALYRYLTAHPRIYMPAAKEVEFFSDESRYERGLDWYWDSYFSGAPVESIKGEATTHYMMYPAVPARIRKCLPNVRLLAILRNPIERAYSHYRMSRMRGLDERSFERAVHELLDSPPDAPDPTYDYVRFGEYAAILRRYFDVFGGENLRVLFYEELETSPASVVREAFEFLGADPEFEPPNLGERYNVGGSARFPRLSKLAIRVVGRLQRTPVVERVVTRDRYEAFKFWTRTELSVKREAEPGPNARTRSVLVDHYRAGVGELATLLGTKPPWPELE